MSNKKQPFEKLLEHYVFSAASQFIDQADLVTQSKIIDLFNTVSSTPLSPDTVSSGPVPKLDDTIPVGPHEKQLKKQWQEALNKPSGGEKGKKKKIRAIQRLISAYQAQIDHTVVFIDHFQKLLNRTQRNITDKQVQANLTKYYQSIIDRKVVYLTRMQTLREKELNKL